MNQLRKSRLVAGVVIILVFAAGVAVGFFVHQSMPHHGFPGLAIGGPPSGPPRELKGLILGRLDRELKLAPDQHARIDSVLTRGESDIRALMSETRPRFEAIASRTRSEVRAVLTPEQQQQFTQITRQIDERRARRREP
jgi:periplasmic protein CpxP/Spy